MRVRREPADQLFALEMKPIDFTGILDFPYFAAIGRRNHYRTGTAESKEVSIEVPVGRLVSKDNRGTGAGAALDIGLAAEKGGCAGICPDFQRFTFPKIDVSAKDLHHLDMLAVAFENVEILWRPYFRKCQIRPPES